MGEQMSLLRETTSWYLEVKVEHIFPVQLFMWKGIR